MVDTEHDFFKSCFGMPEPLATIRRVTGRTFCHMAILKDEPLAVNDAKVDHLCRETTSVKDLGGAAYLGIPLFLSTGEPIGSACVVDPEPRVRSDLEVDVLREFAQSEVRDSELRMLIGEHLRTK